MSFFILFRFLSIQKRQNNKKKKVKEKEEFEEKVNFIALHLSSHV